MIPIDDTRIRHSKYDCATGADAEAEHRSFRLAVWTGTGPLALHFSTHSPQLCSTFLSVKKGSVRILLHLRSAFSCSVTGGHMSHCIYAKLLLCIFFKSIHHAYSLLHLALKNKHTTSQSSRKPGVGNTTGLSDDWDVLHRVPNFSSTFHSAVSEYYLI